MLCIVDPDFQTNRPYVLNLTVRIAFRVKTSLCLIAMIEAFENFLLLQIYAVCVLGKLQQDQAGNK